MEVQHLSLQFLVILLAIQNKTFESPGIVSLIQNLAADAVATRDASNTKLTKFLERIRKSGSKLK